MIIKNNGKSISINDNGDIIINNKVYKDKGNHCGNLKKKLIPIFKDNDVEFEKIPQGFQKRITNALDSIYATLDKENNEHKIALIKLREFGLLEEQRESLEVFLAELRKSAYKLGLGNLDNNYLDGNNKVRDALKFKELNESINREYLEYFINHFKEVKSNDFSFFYETLNDFGIEDNAEILKLYNDEIDSSFKLSSSEFSFISMMKKELIEMQMGIIQDAKESGYGIPKDLLRFSSYSNRIKDETINPQKIKMIQKWDFQKNKDTAYSNRAFNEDGSFTNLGKDVVEELYKKQVNLLNIDSENSIGMVNLQLVKNNGFSFNEMKEWALYSSDNNMTSPQKAMNVATTGIVQCNKLMECGILKTNDGENFEFTTPRAREILFDNQNATYNELANLMIKDHNIIFGDFKEDVNRELFKKQKTLMEEFLDNQFATYYLPQGREYDIEKFKEDIFSKDSEESQYFNRMFPELKKGTSFIDFIESYIDNYKYNFEREVKLDFKNSKVSKEIEDVWNNARHLNMENKKKESTYNFINMSAVRFDGVDKAQLTKWAEQQILSGRLNEELAYGFVEESLSQARNLEEIGILKSSNGEKFSFVDDFAKESLYLNYDKHFDKIKEANRGVKSFKSIDINANEFKKPSTSSKIDEDESDNKDSWQSTAIDIIEISKKQSFYQDKSEKEVIDTELNMFSFDEISQTELKKFLYEKYNIKYSMDSVEKKTAPKSNEIFDLDTMNLFKEKLIEKLYLSSNKEHIKELLSQGLLTTNKEGTALILNKNNSLKKKDSTLLIPIKYDSLNRSNVTNIVKALDDEEDIIDVEVISNYDDDAAVSADVKYIEMNKEILANFTDRYLNDTVFANSIDSKLEEDMGFTNKDVVLEVVNRINQDINELFSDNNGSADFLYENTEKKEKIPQVYN